MKYLRKLLRWLEVATCRHSYVSWLDPKDGEYKYVCTKCCIQKNGKEL